MNVSVVIITACRVDVLRTCLQALQAELESDDEMIVVSASGDQREDSLVSEFSRLRVIDSDRRCMPYQRNLGIAAARHDIVAFVDDDATVQPGWREALLQPYSDETVGSVVGREILVGYEDITCDQPPGVKWTGTITPLTHYTAISVCDVKMGQGCNMSFRKGALERIGGFDPNYIVKAYGEETDVFTRLDRAGMRIVFNPNAVVIHDPATPVEYGRSAFDKRAVFFHSRNYAYFFSKYYLLRLPFWGYMFIGSLQFFYLCFRRITVIFLHTALVFGAMLAGKFVGICEGIKWHMASARYGSRAGGKGQ